MKEEDSYKRRVIVSEQLKEKIKKKMYIQQLGKEQYAYSLLKKKGQTFFLTNERLLILNETDIGYARNIPESTMLPFYHPEAIPQRKVQVSLKYIHNVITQNEDLIIEFSPETKLKNWEFVCDQKGAAIEWKQAILAAMEAYELNGDNHPIAVTIHHNEVLNSVASSALYKDEQVNNSNLGSHPPSQAFNIMSVQNNTQYQPEKDIPAEDKLEQNHIVDVVNESGNNVQTTKPQTQLEKEVIEQIGNQVVEAKNGVLNDSSNQLINKDLPYYPPEPFDKSNPVPDFVVEYQQKKASQPFIPNLECHWDYQFIKGDKQYLVIQRFKKQVQGLSKVIIDQLALRQSSRQFHPVQQVHGTYRYIINSIIMELSSLQLSQVAAFEDSNTVISSVRTKKTRNEFKNANYILQCTRNKGRFVIPLMMLTQYKGFQVFARHILHTSSQLVAAVSTLQHDSAQLQQETKINRNLFENENNIKVVSADRRWFERMSQKGSKRKDFDCCFLNQIKHYLPQDFFGVGREGSQQYQLRAQLLADEQYQSILFDGSDLSSTCKQSKISNEAKAAINLLTDVSSSIPLRASTLVEDLQNLDETFTNSYQLSELMHSSGINIRYLGLLLEIAKEPWLRSYIISEMAARAAKYYLRYELLESSFNLGVDSASRAQDYQIGLLIGWLNKLLGVGKQSDILWRSITRQALLCFRATISRQGINAGFFLQALMHHGCFKVNFQQIMHKIFETNELLSKNSFIQFTIKSSVFDPSFTDHYQSINSRLQTLSAQNFQSLNTILSTNAQGLPASHYSLNNLDNDIVLYLSNWISPMQHPSLYRYISISPSRTYYGLQLTSIKWFLKGRQIHEAQRIKDVLVGHIHHWLGSQHPFLTQLFDLFSHYHLSFNDQFSASLNYAKMALNNQEKLLGPNHFKIADAYYSLANVYAHYSKKTQALHCFKKALAIIAHNQQGSSVPFVQTGLKVAEFCLQSSSIAQAEQLTQTVLNTAQELNLKQSYLSAAQLLARCYEVGDQWNQYFKLSQQLAHIMHLYSDSLPLFQRVLKLVLFPQLQDLARRSRHGGALLMEVLNNIPENGSDPAEAYMFIMGQLAERSFPLPFLQYVNNFQSIAQDGEVRSLSKIWRGFVAMSGVSKGMIFLRQFDAVCTIVQRQYIEEAISDI